MKIYIHILVIAIIAIALNSCSKDDYESSNFSNINCTLDYSTNPKNAQYQHLVNEYAKKGFVGITILVDHPVDGLWIGSSGYASIENNIKMTPCHLHHTASIYKTYIAVIIMQLIEEGNLHLDDNLSNYIDNAILDKIPNGKTVTINNLLQHRSGMPDIFEENFLLDYLNNPTKQYSVEELLSYLYKEKATSAPGTDFYYSDANFALLSLVINKITGSYSNAIRTRIFNPLNLTESFFVENTSQIPKGVAESYWDRYGDGKIENITDWQVAATTGFKGTDGIITSANDMKLFLNGLFKGNLVSPSSLTKMTTFVDVPATITQEQGFVAYGLGIAKIQVSNDDVWYGHFGNHVGSGAIAIYNPSRDITVVVFQNTGTFFSDKIKPIFYNQLIADIEKIAYL